MAIKISLEELLKAGAHFGHQARRWNPKMKPYLYGVQEGVHVFDLTKTKKALEGALEVIHQVASKGRVILLVGTKKQAREKIREVGEATGTHYVNERWLGGTITNFEQIQKSIKKLSDMKKAMQEGEYDKFTKKERLLLEREIERLERFFGGVKNMKDLPDILFIVDIKKEKTAIKEAKIKGVTTVAIVDSNCDPTLVDYPIPMNDDATKAIEYAVDLVGKAISEGKKGKKGKENKNEKDSPKN